METVVSREAGGVWNTMRKMGRVRAGFGLALLSCGLGSGYWLTHRPAPVTLDAWRYGHDAHGRPIIEGRVTNKTDRAFRGVSICFDIRQAGQPYGSVFTDVPVLKAHQTKPFRQVLGGDTRWDAVKIEPAFMQDDSVVNTSSHPAPTWQVH